MKYEKSLFTNTGFYCIHQKIDLAKVVTKWDSCLGATGKLFVYREVH